jgi:hypothetical protein
MLVFAGLSEAKKRTLLRFLRHRVRGEPEERVVRGGRHFGKGRARRARASARGAGARSGQSGGGFSVLRADSEPCT